MINEDCEVTERLFRVANKHEIDIREPRENIEPETLWQLLNAKILDEAEMWTLPEWRFFEAASYDNEKRLFEIDRSVIGSPGGKHYGICDALGLVSTLSGAGSMNVLVPKKRGDLVLDNSEKPMLELLSTSDQIYHVEERYEAVDYQRLVYHSHNEEAIYSEVQLQNHSLEKTEFTFYVHLAPITSKGIDPIEHIRLDESNNTLFANNMAALTFSEPPTSVMLTTADSYEIDKYLRNKENRIDDTISDESGLATALLRYDVELEPAGKRIFYFASPLRKNPDTQVSQLMLDETVRKDTIRRWFEFHSSTSVDDIPDDNLNHALGEAKARIAIQIYSTLLSSEKPKSSVLTDSEKARVLLAFVRMNPEDAIYEIVRDFTKSTISTIKETDTLDASLIWSILKVGGYQQPSIPEDNLRELTSQVYRILAREEIPEHESNEEEIPSPLNVQQDGMSEAAHAEEEPQPKAASFEEIHKAFWGWAVLDEIAGYTRIGEKAQEIQDHATRLQNYLAENLALLKKEQESENSHSEIDLYWITKAAADIALVKPDCFDLDAIDNIMNSQLQKILNLERCQHKSEGALGNHLLRIASYYAYRKRSATVMKILDRVVSETNSFHQVPNTITKEGTVYPLPPDGSICAAADLILLVQTMLLSEQDGNLLVFPSITDQWYASREPMLVSEIPSAYGRVTLEVGTSTNQHQLEVALRNLPEELLVFVPHRFSISMAKSFGGTIIDRVDHESNPYLRVIPLTESVVVTFPK